MNNYKFDYEKNSFCIEHCSDGEKYYLKVKNSYIEVTEDVYNVCKSSYNKIRYTSHLETAKSVIYYDNLDSAVFFIPKNDISLEEKLYIKDLVQQIRNEIELLSIQDRKIAECIFLIEMSISETARYLGMPRTTISYRKEVIRKKILKKIQKYSSD